MMQYLRISADMHVHSAFSVDSHTPLLDMCHAAAEKGLAHICFAEHIDFNKDDEGYGYFDFDKYSEAIDSARKEFGHRLHIMKGLEFAEPHLYPAEFEDMAGRDFDVIIGSVHWVGDYFPDHQDLLDIFSIEEYFIEYYNEVLKTTEFGGFDILAHLDFPKRYLKQLHIEQDITDEILKKVIASGIALEINTSPLRKGLNESSPGEELLKRYFEYGGKKITVGSDAHSCPEVGAGIEYADGLMGKYEELQRGIFIKREFIPAD